MNANPRMTRSHKRSRNHAGVRDLGFGNALGASTLSTPASSLTTTPSPSSNRKQMRTSAICSNPDGLPRENEAWVARFRAEAGMQLGRDSNAVWQEQKRI